MPPIPRHARQSVVGMIPLTKGGLDADLELIDDITKSVNTEFPEGKVLVLPDFVVGARCAQLLRGTAVHLGARDVSVRDCKAESGIPDAKTLSDVGVEFVNVSHDDDKIIQKTEEVMKNGMKPLICKPASVGPGPASQLYSHAFDNVRKQVEAVLGTSPRPQELEILCEAFCKPHNKEYAKKNDVENKAESDIRRVMTWLKQQQSLVHGVNIECGILRRIQRVGDLKID